MTNKLKFSAISNRGKQLMYTEARNKSWEMQANEKKKKKNKKSQKGQFNKGKFTPGAQLKKAKAQYEEWSDRTRMVRKEQNRDN